MKLYRRLLTSYLLVCLIPLLLSLYTTVRLERGVQDSILSDQESVVVSIQRETDQKLSDAASTAGVLLADSTITHLAERYDFSDADTLLQEQVIETLLNSRRQQQAITHAFVFFCRSGRLVSESRGYSPDVIDLYSESVDIPYQVFAAALLKAGENYSYTVQPVVDREGLTYLLVSCNLYTPDYKERLACVGLLMRVPWNLLQWEGENSEIFLMQGGVKIFGSPLTGEAVRRMEDGQPQGELTLDGGAYVYMLEPSEVCDMQYGFLTAQAEYYQGVRLLQIQILCEILIYVLFGIAASIFFSRRSWSPYQKVLDFVRARCAANPDLNSFESVQRALQSIADEKDRLQNRLSQSDAQRQARYISRYLLGFSSDSSALSQYIEDGQPYRLVLFSLIRPESSEFFRNVPKNRYAETLEMLYFAVRNILEEILLEDRDGVSILIEDCVVFAVQETPEGGVIDKLDTAVRMTEQALSLAVACYAGPSCRSLREGPAAWEEVQRLYREDAYWGRQRQPGVRLNQGEAGGFVSLYPAHARELAVQLQAGDFPRARESLETILREDLEAPGVVGWVVRNRVTGLAQMLAAMLPDGGGAYLREISGGSSGGDQSRLLREMFAAIEEGAALAKAPPAPDRNAQLVETVRQYIEANYQDPALNASMVADHLSLSLSTLSRRFKNAAGHGLLDEIHLVRLRHAKALLQGGMTVRETAEKTGYIESRAMIRAFKRYEGVTPGQYAGNQ